MIVRPGRVGFRSPAVGFGGAVGGAVNTVSLANFNEGTGTSTTDGVGTVTWALSGSSAMVSANKKFGAGSLLTTDTLASGFGAQASGMASGTNAGTWTWEGWYYPDDGAGSSFGRILLSRAAGTSTTSAAALLYLTPGVGGGATMNLTLWNQAGTSLGTTGNVNVDTPGMESQAWNHWAVVRTAGTYYMYVNGTRVYSSFGALGDVGDFTYQWLGGDSVWDVHWDDVRVSNTDRYTGASYTVPASEFTVD